MKLNAVQTHEEICKWIASTRKQIQLDVLTLFVTDTFAKRFPESSDNVLHGQLINNMLTKIDEQREKLKFPATDEHIEYTKPVNEKDGH